MCEGESGDVYADGIGLGEDECWYAYIENWGCGAEDVFIIIYIYIWYVGECASRIVYGNDDGGGDEDGFDAMVIMMMAVELTIMRT